MALKFHSDYFCRHSLRSDYYKVGQGRINPTYGNSNPEKQGLQRTDQFLSIQPMMSKITQYAQPRLGFALRQTFIKEVLLKRWIYLLCVKLTILSLVMGTEGWLPEQEV